MEWLRFYNLLICILHIFLLHVEIEFHSAAENVEAENVARRDIFRLVEIRLYMEEIRTHKIISGTGLGRISPQCIYSFTQGMFCPTPLLYILTQLLLSRG